MTPTVSLKKIAQLAQVSTATVSRALHGLPGISDEKRDEILAIVKKTGMPKQRSSTTSGTSFKRTPKTGTICLIQTNTGHLEASELFLRQLQSISERAAHYGMDLTVAFDSGKSAVPACITEKRTAGIIVLGGKLSETFSQHAGHLPSVWLASHSKLPRSMVMEGNQSAGELASDYLMQRGHKHLGAFYLYEHHVHDIRVKAFVAHAREMGATVHRIWPEASPARKSNESAEAWYRMLWEKALKRWEAISPRPTGLFSPDDALTAHLYPLLYSRGIRVGKDIDIVSFGNKTSFLAGLYPPPATIDIGPWAMGRQAVDLLYDEISQSSEGRFVSISIQPVLVPPAFA